SEAGRGRERLRGHARATATTPVRRATSNTAGCDIASWPFFPHCHVVHRIMLDLHCHLLPGIDDGACDLDTALHMARIAVADGIRTIACTPHIYPGMYDNDAPGIRAAIAGLQSILDAEGIALELVEGADVHLEPGLADAIRLDRVPTIAGS